MKAIAKWEGMLFHCVDLCEAMGHAPKVNGKWKDRGPTDIVCSFSVHNRLFKHVLHRIGRNPLEIGMMEAIDWRNRNWSNQLSRTTLTLWVLCGLIHLLCRYAFECHDHIT